MNFEQPPFCFNMTECFSAGFLELFSVFKSVQMYKIRSSSIFTVCKVFVVSVNVSMLVGYLNFKPNLAQSVG